MIKFDFKNIHLIRNVIREISILRQLSQMHNNLFTITLKDIICPVDINDENSLAKFNYIFLVTEYVETDIQSLVQVESAENFDDTHQLVIIYNMLCAMNYLHSANIMHRDLKSANVLVDEMCHIKICDFGMARTMVNFEEISR